MKPISYIVGDATKPQTEGSKIIAHVCNDVGGWGKGFVLALSKISREPELAYRQWYVEREINDFALGKVQFVPFAPDTLVANMIGQHKTRTENGVPPIRYQATEEALSAVCQKALELQASVHLPRIGCGLAGGEWSKVEPLIKRQLSDKDVSVFVYDLA